MHLLDRHRLHALLALLASLALGLGCPSGEEPDPPPDETELDGGTQVEPDAGDVAPDAGEQPGPDAGITGPPVTFKVMTWNVHDLFDEVNDDWQDWPLSSKDVDAKLEKLARVIRAANPDILALQEVEKKELLARLNAKLSNALPHQVLERTYDPRGINVALMSRFPVVKVQSHASERVFTPDGQGPFTFSRDCLEVQLDVGGNRVVAMLVNHHISMLEDHSETKRQAQANGAKEIANRLRAENPFLRVIIAGDMNADEGSPTIAIMLDNGNYVDIGQQADERHRWTYVYGGEKQRLDYLLPDSTLASWCASPSCGVYFVHSSDVSAASDHEPVTASFTFP
ncbi:MAG: endonuclease/exonuclease/phosphatase family protein [Myxococcales bacterium]|jgi:endonuclease/exonuclease/phosphatase family metal-dependent hydrolase